MAFELINFLFASWKNTGIPYLQQISQSHTSCNSIDQYSDPKPVWNIKLLPNAPSLPWKTSKEPSPEMKLLRHVEKMKDELVWFQNMSPEWVDVNDGKSDQSTGL